jgi:DNA-binding NtrC family response regulator
MTVLALCSSSADRQALREIISHTNWRLLVAGNWSEALNVMQAERVTVLICEEDYLEGHWTDLLDFFDELPCEPAVIVTSDAATDQLWAEALNKGAVDVLMKPFDRVEVLWSVAAAARHALAPPHHSRIAANA